MQKIDKGLLPYSVQQLYIISQSEKETSEYWSCWKDAIQINKCFYFQLNSSSLFMLKALGSAIRGVVHGSGLDSMPQLLPLLTRRL